MYNIHLEQWCESTIKIWEFNILCCKLVSDRADSNSQYLEHEPRCSYTNQCILMVLICLCHSLIRVTRCWKICLFFKKITKSIHSSFYSKSDNFKNTAKITKYFCYFRKNIWCLDFSLIAQSGHKMFGLLS